jgi:hypothetical protein
MYSAGAYTSVARLVLTERILPAEGLLLAAGTGSRRMSLDLRLDVLLPLLLWLGSEASSSRTVVDRNGVTGVVNHFRGISKFLVELDDRAAGKEIVRSRLPGGAFQILTTSLCASAPPREFLEPIELV